MGEVPITSRGLLSGAGDPSDRSEREVARAVILDALRGGPHRWADLVELCKDEGVSERTARRARDGLKADQTIRPQKSDSGWFWTLKFNLATPLDKLEGGQVEKPPLTRGDTPPGGSSWPLSESGQVGHETAQIDLDTCRCGAPVERFTTTGDPYCEKCGPPTRKDTE